MADARRLPRIGLTYQERVISMEQRLDGTHDRLEAIEKTVDEIHTLLIQARGVIWLATKVSAWIGGVVAVTGGIILIWRAATGH